jgi:hypothetical protein
MPPPALPTGVELDLLLLGIRQRVRAVVRGVGLLLLACWLVPSGAVLLVMSAGALAFGTGGNATLAVLAGGLIAAAGGWLAARHGWRLLREGLSARRRIERARIAYEHAMLAARRR